MQMDSSFFHFVERCRLNLDLKGTILVFYKWGSISKGQPACLKEKKERGNAEKKLKLQVFLIRTEAAVEGCRLPYVADDLRTGLNMGGAKKLINLSNLTSLI
jgi:hypothetical protein